MRPLARDFGGEGRPAVKWAWRVTGGAAGAKAWRTAQPAAAPDPPLPVARPIWALMAARRVRGTSTATIPKAFPSLMIGAAWILPRH